MHISFKHFLKGSFSLTITLTSHLPRTSGPCRVEVPIIVHLRDFVLDVGKYKVT